MNKLKRIWLSDDSKWLAWDEPSEDDAGEFPPLTEYVVVPSPGRDEDLPLVKYDLRSRLVALDYGDVGRSVPAPEEFSWEELILVALAMRDAEIEEEKSEPEREALYGEVYSALVQDGRDQLLDDDEIEEITRHLFDSGVRVVNE